jgi:class 3 adenylate cyclase
LRLRSEARPAGQRQRRVFLFTDIVGSTNLVQLIGDDAWGDLIRWHDATLRSLFTRYGGEEIKRTGDGFFVVFGDPKAAVGCACEVQQALQRHRREHGFAPQVRIGVHRAEAIREEDDYHGMGVHEAARIGALAGGGEILVSRSMMDECSAESLSGGRLVELKGIADPVEVVSIDWRQWV